MHRAPTPARRRVRSLRPSLWTLARSLDARVVRTLSAGGRVTAGAADRWDRVVLRHRMRQALGYDPRFDHPRTYNEKLAWRILHDRNPLLPLTTDKVAVRDYVADRVGSDVLIPVLGVHDDVDELAWDALPGQFVVKASHGCEMIEVVTDKGSADRGRVLAAARSWLGRDYYESSHERVYRGLPRRVIVESLLTDDDGGQPADFKFLVFGGRVALIRVHSDRFGDHRVNFFDAALRPLDLGQLYPERIGMTMPSQADELLTVAEKLAQDFDYARIDLYLARGRVWFGEITHHDGNACAPWHPAAMDRALGDLWRLPIPVRRAAGGPGGAADAYADIPPPDQAWARFDALLARLRHETADC